VTFVALGATLALAASGAPVWRRAREFRLLPPGANTARSGQNADFGSVACTSHGYCVAVGSYTDTHGIPDHQDHQGMVATERAGVWRRARKIELPADASTASGGQEAYLGGVSCTTPGNCVAVGDYSDTNGSYQAMAATARRGVWGRARKIALPTGADAAPDGQRAELWSVTCTSRGNCVAGGEYTDTNGKDDRQAMTARETNSVWRRATKVTLPANATRAAGAQYAGVYSVACTGPGTCLAAGYYNDTHGSGDAQAMVLTSVPR
jgi:hypothetical protein